MRNDREKRMIGILYFYNVSFSQLFETSTETKIIQIGK
jgi:hypothetical protein